MGCGNSSSAELDNEIYNTPGPVGEIFNDQIYLEIPFKTAMHRIRVVSWLPAGAPRGVVIVSHGLHEHALRYNEVAHALTANGIAVYACDHYAHGLSSGERGFIEDYNCLPDNFVFFGNWVHERHPTLKMTILAHSMGTLVAMLSIRRLQYVVAVLFSATPIFPGPDSSSPFGIKFLFPLAEMSFMPFIVSSLASIDPKGPAAPIYMSGITDDVNEQAIMLKDPYRFSGQIMNKTGFEVFKMIDQCKLELPKLRIPFLCMHGSNDTIAKYQGSRYLYDMIGTYFENKNIRIFSNARHELFHASPDMKKECISFAVDYLLSFMTESSPINTNMNVVRASAQNAQELSHI